MRKSKNLFPGLQDQQTEKPKFDMSITMYQFILDGFVKSLKHGRSYTSIEIMNKINKLQDEYFESTFNELKDIKWT